MNLLIPSLAKPYRRNVAAIIINDAHKGQVLIARRSDLKHIWQFPQGGIDDDESPEEAILREVEEEIGTSDLNIISRHPDLFRYDFHPMYTHQIGRMSRKMTRYRGQEQIYFLLKVMDEKTINLDDSKEFIDYRFVSIKDSLKKASNLKKGIYEKVLSYFEERNLI